MRGDPTRPIFHLLTLGSTGSRWALLACVGHLLARDGRVALGTQGFSDTNKLVSPT